jgi:hypothetical protein
MKSDRSSRRSIRSSIVIGVLAGSVFSGSGAFAADPTPISSQAELEAIGTNDLTRAGSYVLDFAGTDLSLSAPTGSTYVTGIFTGTFDGNGKTLSGLSKPLFEQIGKSDDTAAVSDLTLSTAPGSGVTGRGVLANDAVNGGDHQVHIDGGSHAVITEGLADHGANRQVRDVVVVHHVEVHDVLYMWVGG